MSEHELLIRHAMSWAASKQRPLDTDLLETALGLRSFHDEEPATRWPAGSVEQLMLRRWPAHGPGAPDADALVDTLDTFVHFLRATWRMASGSADPKALAKEGRRAAPKMADACADVGGHSQTKVLARFGREVGIDLESATSMADMEARLSQLMESWNSLPIEERQSRMPLTSPAPGVRAAAKTEGLDEWLAGADGDWDDAWDEEEEWVDVFGAFDLDQDAPVRGWDPSTAAEQARRSPFVRTCLRLVEWLAPSKQVTQAGVLRLPSARKVYADLELWRWQQEARALPARTGADPDGSTPKPPISRAFNWQSAADAVPLVRLWSPCEQEGLIDVQATVAQPTELSIESDEDWVDLAIGLLAELWIVAEDLHLPLAPVLGVIAAGLLRDEPATLAELTQMWQEHRGNPAFDPSKPRSADESAEERRGRSRADSDFARSLHFFDDTGIWVRTGDRFELTDLGLAVGAEVLEGLKDGYLVI